MSNNYDFSKFFSSNFTKNFQVSEEFPFDLNSFFQTQQKNMQAWGEAQQTAMEGMQAAMQRQSEIISKMIKDQSSVAQELTSEGTPEAKISRQADLLKDSYESSVANLREIADMMLKSNSEAVDILNKRVTASLNEIKNAAEKRQSGTAKKAA